MSEENLELENSEVGKTIEEQDQLIHEEYVQPKPIEKFIDTATGELVEKEKLSHWQKIKIAAESTGVIIGEPKSGCRRCYGRGYDWYYSDGTPHPCMCIYPTKTPSEKAADYNKWSKSNGFTVNRKMRRNAFKNNKNLTYKLEELIRQGKEKLREELKNDVKEIVKENVIVTPDPITSGEANVSSNS